MLKKWRMGRLRYMFFQRKTERVNNYSTILNLKEEAIYKYSCIVPNKDENLLTLESVYDEQFNHTFSNGHIYIESDLFYLYKLLLCSRTIEQIRLQVHQSFCAYETNFINHIKTINWCLYIPFNSIFIKPQIQIRSIKSRLYHTVMLKNIILNVLQKQQQIFIEKHGDENIFLKKKKKNPSKLEPVKINVLLKYNECKVNINASTDLNKRIYHFSKTRDSLKSTIVAAAVLKVQLFKYINSFQNFFIIDPFCNDGTLILEIISILLSIPNGSPSISYPICNFPLHSPSTFYDVLNGLTMGPKENLNRVYFLGLEENRENLSKAKKNWKHFLVTMPLKTSKNLDSDLESDSLQSGAVKYTINENDNVCSEYKQYKTLTVRQMNEIFHSTKKSEKNNEEVALDTINSSKETNASDTAVPIRRFLLNHVKFFSLNALHLNHILENCVIFTNIINLGKREIKKFEKLILRSDIVATYVFAKEKFKKHTELEFRLILRFISNGQNIIFLQLFSKRKKNIFTGEEEEEED